MSRPRRTLLFAPADRPDRVAKAVGLAADVVIVELEDGVRPENKETARREAGRLFGELDFGSCEAALRINRIGVGNGLADLLAMASWPRKPDLVMLPKVESGAEIRLYDGLMTEMKSDCRFMALIESARGLHNAMEIVAASDRVSALALGMADLSAELNCRPTWEALFTPRSLLVMACGTRGIAALDGPFLDLKDGDGLARECERVRAMGFQGKLCIHPAQIEPVNRGFTPGPQEVEQARKIVQAADAQGEGAITVDGRMVDLPVISAARRTLAAAQRFQNPPPGP